MSEDATTSSSANSSTLKVAAPPQPPRLQGVTSDPNIPLIFNWAWDFYNAVVTNNYYVDSANQFDTTDFDSSTLQDPGSATIATAQTTANEAYVLAAKAVSVTQDWLMGEVTITGTNNTGSFTFSEAQDDTDYVVLIAPKGYTGTPSIDAFTVVKKTYSADKFEFNINGAPGSGASVTYDFVLIREITK